MAAQKKRLTIATKQSHAFKVFPAEGALGGITPSQQYQINFYIETPNVPEEVTHELNENGTLGPQVHEKRSEVDIVRELQCAVVMSIPQAESLARWILSTIETKKDLSKSEGPIM
jgi:hypothetical protein